MRIRAILPPAVANLTACVASAAAPHSIEGLARLVREATQRRECDGDLARALHRFELDQRMDNRTAEELESQAPGPKSIAELERLREAARDMPPPDVLPRFPSPPEPAPDELRGALEAARAKALAYAASLPDFIRTETVRRYEQYAKKRGWTLEDTLTVELTYFERRESYKLIAKNGREPMLRDEQQGGAWSEGEFGSMLLNVFAPSNQAALEWSNWTTLRKRPTYVFSYRIDVRNSSYGLAYGGRGWSTPWVVVGEHGLVYIDRDTRSVMRLDSEADSIPGDFPLKGATCTLDY
jgi:hypothetical protein